MIFCFLTRLKHLSVPSFCASYCLPLHYFPMSTYKVHGQLIIRIPDSREKSYPEQESNPAPLITPADQPPQQETRLQPTRFSDLRFGLVQPTPTPPVLVLVPVQVPITEKGLRKPSRRKGCGLQQRLHQTKNSFVIAH